MVGGGAQRLVVKLGIAPGGLHLGMTEHHPPNRDYHHRHRIAYMAAMTCLKRDDVAAADECMARSRSHFGAKSGVSPPPPFGASIRESAAVDPLNGSQAGANFRKPRYNRSAIGAEA